MANNELEQKRADDLSVGRYTFKKIRETVISFAGTFGGMFVGGKIGGAMSEGQKLPAVYKIPKGIPFIGGKSYNTKQATGGFVGMMVGSLVAGLIIGYEHWRKIESQRIAVDEINKDIASTAAIQPTDKELVAENTRLRGMLAEADAHKKDHREGHEHTHEGLEHQGAHAHAHKPEHKHVGTHVPPDQQDKLGAILKDGPKTHHEHAATQSVPQLG